MTGSVGDYFSSSYKEARERFLSAARAAGLVVDSHIHPLKGREGEELAMDVARSGPADAQSLLILSSACHGVEGYCGSGVQVAALRDPAWRDFAQERGVAVLYVHALNPYGFSHIRRVTHENIDLNRNFQDFTKTLPVNEDYRAIRHLLTPVQWPPSGQESEAVTRFIAQYGLASLQAALTRGQHEFDDGLFFGGTQPSWSNLTVRKVLREHGRSAKRIAWIDIHTGLGPSGVGERIFAARDDAAAFARARSWWNGNGATPVTSIYDGSSTSAYLTGLLFNSAYEECPQAEYTGIAMEYGTLSILETMQALRAEHWLHLHPQTPAPLAGEIKQMMLDAFYTDTVAWKTSVLAQAREAMFQAADGLTAAR